jgi:hypothetical protein
MHCPKRAVWCDDAIGIMKSKEVSCWVSKKHGDGTFSHGESVDVLCL